MERTVTMHGKPLTLIGKQIKKGDNAPMFYGTGIHLEPISLEDFHNKIVVISTFPSIDTPVCSAQMHRFNKILAGLGNDVVLIAISCDLPFALNRYCELESIKRIVVLSDHKELDFGLKYGFVINKLRLLTRGVVVIGKDGKVKYVEYVKELTDEPSYDSAMQAVESEL